MRATEHAGALLREVLKEGDVAVDGTAGRGRDTLLLATLVGRSGRVHAFDIQREALESTRGLLREAGLDGRCTLHLRSHAEMKDALGPDVSGRLAAAVFNLGYLPGSDQTVVTTPESTLPGIRQAMELLRPDGRLVAVCYTGHQGGEAEAELVFGLAQEAKEAGWDVALHGREPGSGRPWVVALTRREI